MESYPGGYSSSTRHTIMAFRMHITVHYTVCIVIPFKVNKCIEMCTLLNIVHSPRSVNHEAAFVTYMQQLQV